MTEVNEDFRDVGRWEEIDQLDLEFKFQWFDVVCLVVKPHMRDLM